MIVILILDGAGQAVSDVCVTLSGAAQSYEVCDNGEDGVDADTTPGSIEIAGIVAGDYTLESTPVPDGYTAAAVPLTVPAGELVSTELILIAIEPATPEPTATELPTATPELTATPEPTATEAPPPTEEPTATQEALPTEEPTATQEPEPTATIEPTATLEPTATIEILPGTPQVEQRLPPPLPLPTEVFLVGDLQDELGCSGDDDAACNVAALVEENGIWRASFALPPGDYRFRVLARSDADRLLGEGGDPDGDDLLLTVPDDTAVVYVAYDSHTGEIVALPSAVDAVLNTDFGVFPFRPAEDGAFELYFDAPAGQLTLQVLFGGQVVNEEQIGLEQDGRLHVVVDDQGGFLTIETIEPGSLAVTKLDDASGALPDACFAVLTGDDELAGQACDADDGAADGVITIPFPNGLSPGSFTLTETRTPEGQPPAPEQPVDLGPGENQIDVTASGSEEDQ